MLILHQPDPVDGCSTEMHIPALKQQMPQNYQLRTYTIFNYNTGYINHAADDKQPM